MLREKRILGVPAPTSTVGVQAGTPQMCFSLSIGSKIAKTLIFFSEEILFRSGKKISFSCEGRSSVWPDHGVRGGWEASGIVPEPSQSGRGAPDVDPGWSDAGPGMGKMPNPSPLPCKTTPRRGAFVPQSAVSPLASKYLNRPIPLRFSLA